MEENTFYNQIKQAGDMKTLKQTALTCSNCSLRAGCQQVVFGVGNVNAQIMWIGEGPGADEDRLGEPFVGRAGQLLDKILASGGFSRQENVYITNVVKCRPPQNRNPLPEEVQVCLPILREEFKRIHPKIIVLLGAVALHAILDPQAGITKSRGQWIEKQGIWFIATYHPAALLRNENLKKDVWLDMHNIVKKYREVVDSQHFPEFKQ
ncbi:MAG TPA: uracil-DNA glycosylase [Bacillota bacterium]|nr:uracil-DNA glycosylase [Bacillota bacterium]